MKAERIGHGYRLMHDEEAYQEYAIKRRVHLESCPHSSIVTGSVPLDWPMHPTKRYHLLVYLIYSIFKKNVY